MMRGVSAAAMAVREWELWGDGAMNAPVPRSAVTMDMAAGRASVWRRRRFGR
jgi:hypothetical protein